jgi:hypothetical protein
MEVWIECGKAFIKADVVRWKEGVYAEPMRRRKKKSARSNAVRTGEREVIAEVLGEADAKGFVTLLVRGCRIVSEKEGMNVLTLKPATEIKRQQKTLLKGYVERLQWSDEAARALIASRFLNL